MNVTKELSITEKQYRALDFLSYSSIKDFAKSRVLFYRKYILKEEVEDKESDAMRLGDLVDFLATRDEDNLEEKFAVINIKRGSGQLFDLCDNLWKHTKRYIDENNIVTQDFNIIFNEAFLDTKFDKNGNEVAFKGKDVAIALSSFIGSDAEQLYKERRNKFGKTIVTIGEIEIATKIRDELYNTEWTRSIFYPSHNIEVIKQLTQTFKFLDIDVKSMMDIVHVDHENKTIKSWDIKCTYLSEDFNYAYWKNYYYLQSAMYYFAMCSWRDENYPDYNVLPNDFISCDTTLKSKPLIWKGSTQTIAEGMNGFILSSGRKVKGLMELIQEIKWHQEKSDWSISKEAYLNNGIMEIRPFEIVSEN